MLDTSLRLLADRERRRILLTLLDEESARDGTAVPSDRSAPSDADPTALYHSHLPKLDEVGLVRWDQEDHTVERGPRFEELRPLLETLDENTDRYAWDWP
jgi:hypothetical protein